MTDYPNTGGLATHPALSLKQKLLLALESETLKAAGNRENMTQALLATPPAAEAESEPAPEMSLPKVSLALALEAAAEVVPELTLETVPVPAEDIPLALSEADQTLADGASVYSMLATEVETETETEPEVAAFSEALPPELLESSERLQAQMAEIQAQNAPKTDFGGTLSMSGVEAPAAQDTEALQTLAEKAVATVPEPQAVNAESAQPVAKTESKPPQKVFAKPKTASPPEIKKIKKDVKQDENRETQKVTMESVNSGGTMADLSGYKDLSKAPISFGDDDMPTSTLATESTFERSSHHTFTAPQHFVAEMPTQEVDTEFSGNVKTLIRLVNELPDGVTKQTGAQIIRLTMEAMGISMEDVLSEAQSAQSEMLDAVRANIKKIEEYKTVIRKLETDIKYYQGKANELSEIIDLFILSNTSSQKMPGPDDMGH